MSKEDIFEIIREMKAELRTAKRKARGLSIADEAQLYYNGVIVGLQLSIAKFEQWYYGTQPPPGNRKRGARRGR